MCLSNEISKQITLCPLVTAGNHNLDKEIFFYEEGHFNVDSV